MSFFALFLNFANRAWQCPFPWWRLKRHSQLSTFAQKSEVAQYNAARRFVRSHGLVFRLGTNESQCSPTELAAEAINVMMTIAQPKVNQPHRHPDFIIHWSGRNSFHIQFKSTTLETAGRQTVHIRKSTNDTNKQPNLLAWFLNCSLVFKGAPEGRITRTEFPPFPTDMIYTCQGRPGCIDEGVMLSWLSKSWSHM